MNRICQDQIIYPREVKSDLVKVDSIKIRNGLTRFLKASRSSKVNVSAFDMTGMTLTHLSSCFMTEISRGLSLFEIKILTS